MENSSEATSETLDWIHHLTTTLTLKPTAIGLVVRDPVTRLRLAAEGEDKTLDTYWYRRLAAGDVVIVTNQLPAEAATPRAPKPP